MKPRRNEKGAAVVEFAILASLLIVFLFGIFEFGFLWLSSYYIANSAREGARVSAKIGGTDPADETARSSAASDAVKRSLGEHHMFADLIDTEYDGKDFVTTTYNTGSISVFVDGENIVVPMAEVIVTVQAQAVWEPVLFPMLNALGGMLTGDSTSTTNEITEISEFASYAIE